MENNQNPRSPALLANSIMYEPPASTITGSPHQDSHILAHHESVHQLSSNFKSMASFDPLQLADSYYKKVIITGTQQRTQDEQVICNKLQQCLALREKWCYKPLIPEFQTIDPPIRTDFTVFVPPPYHPFDPQFPEATKHVCHWQNGIMNVYQDSASLMRRKPMIKVESISDFSEALKSLIAVMNDPETRSLTYKRLMLLEQHFDFYLVLNQGAERLEQIAVPHRDFYNVRKVDTHVHHSSCMNQKHLLRFIKHKLKTCGDEIVLKNRQDSSKPPLSLNQVFESLNMTAHDLSVDTLDVHADNSTFHRFDRFNLKYNPCGQSRLREIFMKTDNYLKGRYLAELTREVLTDLEETKYQMAEYRISIYGKHPDEWDALADWFVTNKIYSDTVRWLIQIPRLYSVYRRLNILANFQEMLDNIFHTLFEVTIDPQSHPHLHMLLQQIVGFDSVDDESVPQVEIDLLNCGLPVDWTREDNPPYTYYSYYICTNLYVLNRFRESKGLNTFKYRPHAGEAGDVNNLAVTYLLAEGINHGLNLKKSPVLQYLFYLNQIGVAMSPLSNNHLFMEYAKNPLHEYFKKGLNVSLSTDDPLQFHYTREALMEEYSVASQIWKLSSSDMCELARNSVIQSGFEMCVKNYWIGDKWWIQGAPGNDITKTNVPYARVRYRKDTLYDELAFVYGGFENIPNFRTLPRAIESKPIEDANQNPTAWVLDV